MLMPAPAEISTLTFLRFNHHKWKGFQLMNEGHRLLKEVRGQSSYKLMGTGRGSGFSPWPDWTTYAILQIWFDRTYADSFFEKSDFMDTYRPVTEGRHTFYLDCFQAYGRWSGKEPFIVHPQVHTGKTAIITRATIKKRYLWKFWKNVPESQQPLQYAPGLLFTKGIGEVPFIQMATFSVWENLEEVKKFAYKSAEHQKMIRLTRELGWYREELFARFNVLDEYSD